MLVYASIPIFLWFYTVRHNSTRLYDKIKKRGEKLDKIKKNGRIFRQIVLLFN